MVKWFFAQVGLLDEAMRYARWVHNYEQEVFKKRPKYRREVYAALRSGKFRAVKIVRNPWHRAPSSFLVLAERGAVRRRDHWVQRHWASVDAWLGERGQDPAEGISFLEHLEMVREMEAKEAHSVNQHVSQQFVEGEQEFVHETIPIEEFRHWTAKAVEHANLKPVDFAAISDSKHHHAVDNDVTASLGERPERARIQRGAYADGRFPAGAVFINEHSRESVRKTFAADMDRYGHLYGG